MTTDSNKPHTSDREGTRQLGGTFPQVEAGRTGQEHTAGPGVSASPRDEGTRPFPSVSEPDAPVQGRSANHDALQLLNNIQENVSKLRAALRASNRPAADASLERTVSERSSPAKDAGVREPAPGPKLTL